ncbi:MAG: hypothetical protein GY861_02350 [bacterium]|nr:hypothetical protein [bacterium]
MKRKVIQIAGSTQLVSLPRKWSKAHNIQKGDELDVQEDGNRVVVSTNARSLVEKAELDISEFGSMDIRYIHSLYKQGVDELRLIFSSDEQIDLVQNAIGKETVGFEIVEQGKNHCIIKYVSGGLEEFDSILRRTFLLLLSMSEETHNTIKEKNFRHLNHVAFLEEANNRFTTICRRYLNKKGCQTYKKLGPLYYIIEELENIADQYKYVCRFLYDNGNAKTKISKEVLELNEKTNKALRLFYESFYRFDKEKISEIRDIRDEIIQKSFVQFKKAPTPEEIALMHHSLTVSKEIFCLTGPLLVLSL